tara:strand:- start:205 stop:411 length:207 start_codon:yes stop_codon:yes gene_type:complete
MQSVRKTTWHIQPQEVNIDFTTPEQNLLREKRLNNANEWLHKSLQANCLWGIVIAKQVYDAIDNKENK